MEVEEVQKCFSAFQLCYQNKSCSECQQDVRKTEKHAKRQTDRQERKTDKDKTTFQLSNQNKSCSECQQYVRKIERQSERQTDGQKDRQIFSLVIKTKLVQNVNRMSER